MALVLAAVCPPFPNLFPHAARREGEQARRFSPFPHAARREGEPARRFSPFPHAARREGKPARCFSPFPPRGGRAGDGGDKHVHDLFVDP
jgi:hypothetical protein